MCLRQLLIVAASGNDHLLDGVTVFIDCDYCIHSNLWNILIIGTQGVNYLILSNSWNESILTKKKLTILIVRTGKFYSVLFSPA